MGGGKKDINFHPNFRLIRRTHFFLNSLSKLGFEKYPSYPYSNEKAKTHQQRAGLIYFGMRILQVLSFFILMKHGAVTQVIWTLRANNLPCNGMNVSLRQFNVETLSFIHCR